jgi:glc operon protein GlcG
MQISAPRATLTTDAIAALLSGAIARARQLDRRIWVAVADASGQIVGLLGCDGAPRISRQVAQDKAFTAAVTGMPTSAWKAYLESIPSGEREIIERHEGFVAADGGFPIFDGELLAGAIGTSGANQAEDADIARAGLAAIGRSG